MVLNALIVALIGTAATGYELVHRTLDSRGIMNFLTMVPGCIFLLLRHRWLFTTRAAPFTVTLSILLPLAMLWPLGEDIQDEMQGMSNHARLNWHGVFFVMLAFNAICAVHEYRKTVRQAVTPTSTSDSNRSP
ncbi:MAG TPA: hypothetical protein VG734_02070 [Lacunisphaera sp.]|nr:hypothetical protein [Lacunisphaera sp.]